MNKRKLHHLWTKIRGLSFWYLLLGLILFSSVAIFALRQNNLTAIRLREEVLAVDKKDGDVESALRELREFVYSHMNADLSAGTSIQQPVQLKYTYERLAKAEKQRVEQANDSVYTQAQKFCEQKYPGSFSGGPRVPCIADYVSKNGEEEKPIPDDLYKFDFVSPRWTPDIAGISILLAAAFFLLLIIRFVLDRWLRLELGE